MMRRQPVWAVIQRPSNLRHSRVRVAKLPKSKWDSDSFSVKYGCLAAVSFLPDLNRGLYSPSTPCTKETAIEPSPTADATRLMFPARTSPTAKTPGRLVSKR